MKRKAILLFCACLALSACGDDGRQVAKTELIREGDAPQIDAPAIEAPVVETPAQATEEVAPVAVEESEEEAAQEDVSFEDFFSREDRINTLLNLMQDSLEEGFGGNYFLSVEDNTIYASVWDDGVTTDAFLTTIRDGGETPQEWVTMRSQFETACSQWVDALSEWGLSDMHIVMSLLNDQNLDNALLMVYDGVPVYDFLEE